MNPLVLLKTLFHSLKSFQAFWSELCQEFQTHWRSYHVRQSLKTIGPYYINDIRRMVELGDLTYDAEVEVQLRKVPVSEFYLKNIPSISYRVIQCIEVMLLLFVLATLLILILSGIFLLQHHFAEMMSLDLHA